jgi:farnesyl diphosphate synthase
MADARLVAFRARCQSRVEETLEQLLPRPEIEPCRLHTAMRYAVLGGGKRIRPMLVYAAGEALGVDPRRLDRAAGAVELIHAYSLIHDDLPAMDDDALRRGRPTCHLAFDEATAILAGDALQTLAFQTLAEATDLDPPTRIAMVGNLARASGSRGMAGGQALDLASTGAPLDVARLEHLHIHKTGGRDQALDKATYPAVVGLADAKEMADALIGDALSAISVFGPSADPLRWFAEALINRKH